MILVSLIVYCSLAQTDLSPTPPTTTTPNADPGEALYCEITSYAALPNARTESESNLSANYFTHASLSMSTTVTSPTTTVTPGAVPEVNDDSEYLEALPSEVQPGP